MNPVVSTARPPLSTVVVSADSESNGHMLDELLAEDKVRHWSWILSRLKPSSRWFTQSSCLGVDDNDNLMYSLTRAETWLLTTGALIGFTLLLLVLKWLIW